MRLDVIFSEQSSLLPVVLDTDNVAVEIPSAVIHDVVTPTASVSKVGTVSTLTVHDINGTTETEILDGAPGSTRWADIEDKPSTFPPSAHNHDDRYYTESEVDTKLAQKAPSVHNHDDRYYTETEIDTQMQNKADAVHYHDSRYYTQAITDEKLSQKANAVHTHDDRYYTEAEIDSQMSAKQNVIDSTHKLSADLVSETGSKKFVAQTEKDTWNAKEDASNKVTTLSASSTDTQYPSAKVVHDTIEDVREIAAGKSTNYTVNLSNNPAFNTQNASISISSFIDINGRTLTPTNLKIGDNVYVTDTLIPDRWVATKSSSAMTLYILETAKCPVQDVQDNGTSVVTNGIANISGKQNVIDASHKLSADLLAEGSTNKLVSQAEKDSWNNKQNAITSSNKLSADLLADGTTNKLVSQTEKNTWNSKQPAGDYMTLNTDQTATSKKTLSYTEPIVLGGQETILNVLSTHNSEDMDAMWAGRVKIGNRDKTFLLGVYKQAQLGQPAICGIGAHSWQDSFEEVGADWEDVYLNPDGNKAIYIGNHDWREGTGWFKVQNTGTDYNGKSYCNRGTILYPNWHEVATIDDASTSATNETWSAYKLNTQFGYKENTSNKVTSISSSSTNTQYPTAKCVYDIVGNIETLLEALR